MQICIQEFLQVHVPWFFCHQYGNRNFLSSELVTLSLLFNIQFLAIQS